MEVVQSLSERANGSLVEHHSRILAFHEIVLGAVGLVYDHRHTVSHRFGNDDSPTSRHYQDVRGTKICC